MSKSKTALYFEKSYGLLVHTLTLGQKIATTAFGKHTAHREMN